MFQEMKRVKFVEGFLHMENWLRKETFSGAFPCPKCSKLWPVYLDMQWHKKTCISGATNSAYIGAVYNPPPTIWNIIFSHGDCTEENFIFPITFDFESFVTNTHLPNVTAVNPATKLTAKHVSLSCSAASRVPGFTNPKLFVNKGDPQLLVLKLDSIFKKNGRSGYGCFWVMRNGHR